MSSGARARGELCGAGSMNCSYCEILHRRECAPREVKRFSERVITTRRVLAWRSSSACETCRCPVSR